MFPIAVKLAKSISTFQQHGDLYSVTFAPQEAFKNWHNFSRLYAMVSPLTGCEIYHKGQPLGPIKNKFFYILQSIAICYDSQNDHKCMLPSGLPGWGCSKVNKVSRHLGTYPYFYWYNYGFFAAPKIWAIDKKRLYQILVQEANRHGVLSICPYFKKSLIKKYIYELPDSIIIDGVNWDIKYKKDFAGSRIVYIPIGITHLEKEQPVYLENIINDIENQKSVDKMSEDEINQFIEKKRPKNARKE